MSRALRSLLFLAALVAPLPSAGAFCVSEVAYDYVMREDFSEPAQSLPCCAIPAASAVALQAKDRPIDGRAPALARVAHEAFGEDRPRIAGSVESPQRWRAYCERSSRLLR